MKEMFQMFAAYNRWANDVVYAAATDLTPEEFAAGKGAFFGSLMGTFNHLLAADRIWLRRMTGTGEAPTALNTILFPGLDALSAARMREDQRIVDYIDSLDEQAITGTFSYTPLTSPQPVTQKLGSALSHLFNHQTHHRGQCHMILTSLGKPSLSLDLIYFQRTEDGRRWA